MDSRLGRGQEEKVFPGERVGSFLNGERHQRAFLPFTSRILAKPAIGQGLNPSNFSPNLSRGTDGAGGAQYCATLGSTSRAHASMPPSTLCTLLKPCAAKRSAMPRLEMPWWQMKASGVSFGKPARLS